MNTLQPSFRRSMMVLNDTGTKSSSRRKYRYVQIAMPDSSGTSALTAIAI